MADISIPSAGFSLMTGVRQVFGTVSGFFDALQRARLVSAEFELLNTLDDAALAARGLSRDSITHYVASKL